MHCARRHWNASRDDAGIGPPWVAAFIAARLVGNFNGGILDYDDYDGSAIAAADADLALAWEHEMKTYVEAAMWASRYPNVFPSTSPMLPCE